MKKLLCVVIFCQLIFSQKLAGQCTIVDRPVTADSKTVCSGDGTIIHVANSQNTVDYQLYNGTALIGSKVGGTGGTINLPTGSIITPTTFTVHATKGACTLDLTTTITVSLFDGALTVTATDATICPGLSTSITVDNSQLDVSYQLRTGAAPVGSAVNGTGGTISLPTNAITSDTEFNVFASLSGTCDAQLTNTATVNVLIDPALSVNAAASSVCPGTGTTITVTAAETGIDYWLKNDADDSTIEGPITGAGSDITFNTGNLTAATTFYVYASDGVCSVELNNKVTVGMLVDQSLSVVAADQTVCSGTGTTITVTGTQAGFNYSLRDGASVVDGPVAGGGNKSFSTGNLTGNKTFNVFVSDGSCSVELTNMVTVEIFDKSLTVTATSPTVCPGSGTTITVDNSQTGVSYQLRNVGLNIGAAVPGDGGTISLPTTGIIAATTFNVYATIGTCSEQLTNTATVNLLINQGLTVAATSRTVCSGTGTTVTVTGTQALFNYYLRDGVTNVDGPIAGGGDISFSTGNLTADKTFNVFVTDGSCSAQLTNTATVEVFDKSLTVTATSPSVCPGSGTTITVDNSQIGVSYQLRNGGLNIGAAVPGDGGTISLPTTAIIAATTFNVYATIGGCSEQLTNTATVNLLINQGLTVAATSGTVCSGTGTTVTVTGTQALFNYYLRDGVTNVDGPVAGGGDISFSTGNLTADKTFNVFVTDGSCSAQLTGTISVEVFDKTMAVAETDATVCPGSTTNITVANSQTGVSYQLRSGVTNIGPAVPGTGGLISLPTGVISYATSFNVYATLAGCSDQLTNTASVGVLMDIGLPVTAVSGTVCSGTGTTVTVTGTQAGYNYSLREGVLNIDGPFGGGGSINFSTGNLAAAKTFNVYATNGSCSAQLANTVTVNVDQLSVGGAAQSAQTICYNAIPLDLTLSGQTGNVIRWEWDSDNVFDTPAIIPGVLPSLTGATMGALTTNRYYRAIVKNGVCAEQPSSSAEITVRPQITLSAVTTTAVCSGSPATINLSGMLNVASDIDYVFNGVTTSISRTPVGGNTSFSLGALGSPDNGKSVVISEIRTGTSPTCSVNPAKGTTVVVNTPLLPVITGNSSVCIGTTHNYQTEPAMTGYNWNTLAGTISGSGNSVNVTWNTTGWQTLTVTYNNSFGCSTSSSYQVYVNALPVPGITGDAVVCEGSAGVIYLANTGMTTYTWTVAGGTKTATASDNRILVTWGAVPGTVTLTGTNSAGCTATQIYPVTVNLLPSPTIISGPLEPRVNPAPYVYLTQPGKSDYEWSLSEGGTGVSAGDSYSVTWQTAGDHKVFVNYKVSGCKAVLPFEQTIHVKELPSITNVHINYNTDDDPKIGGVLEVHYDYTDGSSTGLIDLPAFVYVWKRGATVIGTNSPTYTATIDDKDHVLTCTVTPASTYGPPNTGAPVTSTPTHPIEDLSLTEPVASEVCIDGIRTANATLTGKYKYTFSTNEGSSEFKWIKDDADAIPRESTLGTGLTYILKPEDIGPNKEIIFEVTPKSANYHTRTGAAVRSNPLAKITGLNDQYGVNEPAFALTANVAGGFFSGPGVTGNMFSPELATAGSWVINHFRIYEYAASCSQKASQDVVINPSQAYFSPALNNRRLCSYDLPLTVTVENMQAGAIPPVDVACVDENEVSDMAGISYDGIRTITIDPENLRAGRHVLTYIYSIWFPPLPPLMIPRLRPFKVQGTFIVERVRQDIKYLGLSDKYCADAINQTISVEGVNPLEGTDHWEWTGTDATGDLLDDERTASAVFIPHFCKTGNEYRIKYRYEGPLGCLSNQLDEPLIVHDLPDAGFNIAPYYNIDGEGDVLEPNNSGGVFSGEGMSGNTLIPSLTHEGIINITYTYTNTTTLCTNQKTLPTTIRKVKGNFTVRDTICYQNANINISVENLPTTGTVIKNGFTNTRNTLSAAATLGTTSATYSIPAAGEGNDTLRFSYNWDGVDFTVQKVINIDSLGSVVIYNLEQDQIICDDVAPFELTVSKTGGIFYGPVVANKFDPSKATIRDTVKYTFKNPKSVCRTSAIVYVNVYKAPRVDFIPYDVCINDEKDTLRFMNKTASIDPVVKWKWEFDDEGTIKTDANKEAGYLYLKGGYQKVTLSAETDKGCFVRVEKTFNIGRRPDADFYWKQDCYHPGEVLQLFDATTYTTQPKSWSWKSNGVEFGTSNNAVYPKADTGLINLEYIVRTDYYQCHDTVKKSVYIRPAIAVNGDGYFEDFEEGRAGWIIGDTSSIWSFGAPNGTEIKSASSGKNAWFTAEARDGSSAVESPCFDLTAMSRPVIKLKLRKDMDKDRDGAALQYKIGDEPFWHPVGTIDDGIEWYNSATISGKPGGDALGWTTAGATDDGYKSAIHTLDEMKGKKDVKFRIIYGSAGAYSDHDGIAFDDVFLGERSRHVLVEHFTSYNSAESMNYKALVDTIAEHKRDDVINIQYHTNLSGIDSLFVHNPGEINARIMFYGLSRVPYTFVDGGNNSNFNMLYDYRSNPIDSNTITKRTLVNSRFRVYIDPVISGRILTVKGYIKALENVTANNLTLFIAVTEKRHKNHFTGVSQNTEFLNVFRKFIPDASGILMKNSWAAGDSVSIAERSWTIDKVLNSSDIEIIAFLQNSDTKEVYQAFSVIKPELLVGIENPPGREGQFSLFPNPASNNVTIGFAGPLRNEAVIRIYSIQGEVIREYRAGQGSRQFTIEDPGLKGGIYLVRVSYGVLNMGYKKLIITED